MARYELKLPQMGESVVEATITNWLKAVGDKVQQDEIVLEIATDKVDSEIPSEVAGVLVEILFEKDCIVQVGQTLAIIETAGGTSEKQATATNTPKVVATPVVHSTDNRVVKPIAESAVSPYDYGSFEFLSPLVKSIAKEEGVSANELKAIRGTGLDDRITKDDILKYVKNRAAKPKSAAFSGFVSGYDEMIEMDRMRKLISGYMVSSIQTSAHVQTFIEVDVTEVFNWREEQKDVFMKEVGEKLTLTPLFIEAVAKALVDFPLMNISVYEDKIIKKKDINIGMATALPTGNLIVPVIKKADKLSLVELAKAVNDLGARAKAGKLNPDDIQGGTYTVTNIGSFGSLFGTPIINQPEVGILAIGAVRKVPAVIETKDGDVIGIRKKMFLSHSYDHRVVDGALGGAFVQRVAHYLENFKIVISD